MPLLLLAIGGLLLYFGAEWLVAGASRLALAFGLPELVVGLTVVAYGTSLPEVIVGIQAARGGHGDVALGNVIGSNVANLGLVLGGACLLRPARIDGALRRRELPVLVASALLLPLVVRDGRVSVPEGALLVLGAVLYTAWTLRVARRSEVATDAVVDAFATAEAAESIGAPPPSSLRREAALVGVGLATLLGGGHLFVEGATALALSVGMSERLVGLTVVAVGTSLPELATSLIAAHRGRSEIAVGNVLGSNAFNVLLCLGAAGSFGAVEVDPRAYARDIVVLVVVTVLAAVFLRTERRMRRWEGGVLVLAYAAFLVAAAL